MIQILELFGGIGSPRCALRNLGIPIKAIDYVEIDKKAVRSYNAMFKEELEYKTQSVVGWNLKPDILIHGSPCQDFSIAGHQKGGTEGSETRSSLMWETIHIIQNMGVWKPRYVIWENVKNVLSKYMVANFNRYLHEMEKLGYANAYAVLDARSFGLPQARQRVFTVSTLGSSPFDFDSLAHTPMKNISEFLLDNRIVPNVYDVTQPSVLQAIGGKGIKSCIAYPVISKTVQQFTGVLDETGKKIFEGDIVDILTENEERGVITYENGVFVVKASTFVVDFMSNINGEDVEVLGNIVDNPELLG